jgi:hypothetical protein
MLAAIIDPCVDRRHKKEEGLIDLPLVESVFSERTYQR